MSTTSSNVLPAFSVPKEHDYFLQRLRKPYLRTCPRSKSEFNLTISRSLVCCSTRKHNPDSKMDRVDTCSDVESFAHNTELQLLPPPQAKQSLAIFVIFAVADKSNKALVDKVIEWVILVSPFFFWGTSMVAMKEVIPKMGPFFVSAFRLIPAGTILIGFAAAKGRQQPAGLLAWISILLFAVVDGACFQGFLVEGLQRTTAGLGSVIIDSQPLTVSVLAAVLFGESISNVGAAGLLLGIIGLLLLEIAERFSDFKTMPKKKTPTDPSASKGRSVSTRDTFLNVRSNASTTTEVPAISLEGKDLTIWGSGEWWMLLAAQCMAIGTVMVRWVSKYSDPVMATGWHMIIGGLPLLVISVFNHDPALTGSILELTFGDIAILLYTSIFGSAISYGVFFYNATRGSLTKLSSLTFLTPLFASIFGFLYLSETFSPSQFGGALVTLVGIYLVNCPGNSDNGA